MRAILSSSFLITLLLLLASGLATAQPAQLPEGHERWMGTWEEESGKGEVYDFRFQPSGEVLVEKSTGTKLFRQTFNWTITGNDIRLQADQAGEIPELNGINLTKAGDHRFDLKLSEAQVITIRRSFTALSWIHALFLFALVFVGNEVCRRYKFAPYVVYFILPFALIPVFLHSGFDSVFRWTKLYSAIAGCIFFTLFRFNGLNRFRWAKITVAAILAINIFEACTQDFTAGQLPNLLNATAGILNIITISRWMGIRRDDTPPHDMLWPGMTVGWILAYDIWNITFVYLNFPNTVLFTFMILVAPTLAALFVKKGTWMQARAYALGIYMLYIFSVKALADNYFNLAFTLPLPRNDAIVLGLALVSLAANVVYAILHFRWRFTGKAPSHLQIGQAESVI